MAVYQISKIQIRRGLKESLPQLASGEMAWAIDTQELFIGNGSVSEGAPSVGYTKLLTNQDISTSLIDNIKYTYGSSSIQTGPTANSPIITTLQEKLAQTVTSSEFGTVGNGLADDTTSIQRAINQLFANSTNPASGNTTDSVKARITLRIPAGIYKITSTIFLPSYTSIEGEGIDRTIFLYTGTASAFSTTPNFSTTSISVSNLTIKTDTNASSDIVLLNLFNTDNSNFENLKLEGVWGYADLNDFQSKGIKISQTAENLNFRNIDIKKLCFGVYSNEQSTNIRFDTGFINQCGYGFLLGSSNHIAAENQIINYKFLEIYINAVIIDKGTDNYMTNCSMVNVGNGDPDAYTSPVYTQVYFNEFGNICNNLHSDRATTTMLSDQYIPEVSGSGEYTSKTIKTSLADLLSPTIAFKLPFNTDRSNVIQPIAYQIPYVFTSESYTRSGTITITADGTGAPGDPIDLNDDFIYSGSDDALELSFSAEMNHLSIMVMFDNTVTLSTRNLTYHYTAVF